MWNNIDYVSESMLFVYPVLRRMNDVVVFVVCLCMLGVVCFVCLWSVALLMLMCAPCVV